MASKGWLLERKGVSLHTLRCLDDVQPFQWLVAEDGNIKLNDFNRAEFMLYDEGHGEYCKYRNGVGPGDYRAPEEYHNKPLDEKLDIFSLGNNFVRETWHFFQREVRFN